MTLLEPGRMFVAIVVDRSARVVHQYRQAGNGSWRELRTQRPSMATFRLSDAAPESRRSRDVLLAIIRGAAQI
jgi:hypothetical protein